MVAPMSTLWTPEGERPIRRTPPPPPETEPAEPEPTEMTEAEQEEQLALLQAELAQIPPEVVIANHAFGLFQLAAVHLSIRPPQLAQARTAIDALAALVEGMAGRLGEPERDLVEALAQLRMGYVQVSQPGPT